MRYDHLIEVEEKETKVVRWRLEKGKDGDVSLLCNGRLVFYVTAENNSTFWQSDLEEELEKEIRVARG